MKKIISILLLILIISSCIPSLHTRAPGYVVVDREWNFSSGYHLIIMESDSIPYDMTVSRKEYKITSIGDTL